MRRCARLFLEVPTWRRGGYAGTAAGGTGVVGVVVVVVGEQEQGACNLQAPVAWR